ncbi:MAG: pyridoxal phosphate-dependent aminotransferase [Saprospirales bacterium]|nr:pyridoxal phosphate-dependent aminotransferase [Saprospirales bacterium]
MDTIAAQLLSRRVLEMEESATLRMAQLARNLTAQGLQVINLSLGEPDFDTPDHIKEAAKKALDDGYTKYSPVPGLVELRQAIVRKFKRDNDLDFSLNQIVVSNGAKQSLANLSLALLNEGDEAIILAPYWVSYYEIIRLGGGKPVAVKAGIEQDFKVTPPHLKAAITEHTKFVLFSSPCNPTGSVYSREELKGLADVIAKHDNLLIIADEIYEYINFTDQHVSIGAFDNVRDRTITVNGFAKGFAMTGWRLGYMGAPAWIAEACTKIQGQVTSGANSFAQKAGAYALDADLQPTYEMRDAFLRRRDLTLQLLEDVPGLLSNHPQGAFYVFPDVSYYFGKSDGTTTIQNADDLAMYILENAHVALVSGSGFGADECIRISFAASDEDLIEATRRMKEVLGKLK